MATQEDIQRVNSLIRLGHKVLPPPGVVFRYLPVGKPIDKSTFEVTKYWDERIRRPVTYHEAKHIRPPAMCVKGLKPCGWGAPIEHFTFDFCIEVISVPDDAPPIERWHNVL